MKKQYIHPFLLIVIAITSLIQISCLDKRKAAEKGISQGTIYYNITYPETLNSHRMSFLFPSNMTVFFSGENQKASFDGSMGLYKLDFIHNSESDSFFTLLKILERRLYVPSPNNSDIFLFENHNNSQVVYDDTQVREIAGFNCEKATIIPKNPNKPNFNIWYTREIGVEKPNRNTPFNMVPGIMMEFELVYENVLFKVKAHRVVEEVHEKATFSIPSNYEQTTINDIEKLIKSVLK